MVGDKGESEWGVGRPEWGLLEIARSTSTAGLLHFLRNAFELWYDCADRGHTLSNPNGLLGALCVPHTVPLCLLGPLT